MCDYNNIMISAINSYKNDDKWENALFKGIKLVSNTAVGSVGQTFVRNVCDELGIDNEHPEIEWRQMRGMRNRIVHDYEGIRLEIVWETIQNDFPELLKKMLPSA